MILSGYKTHDNHIHSGSKTKALSFTLADGHRYGRLGENSFFDGSQGHLMTQRPDFILLIPADPVSGRDILGSHTHMIPVKNLKETVKLY